MALSGFKPISVFITGANRGIGIELVKQFINLPNPPRCVVGTYRNPEISQDLLDIAAKNSNVHAIKYDVTDYDSLPDLIQQVETLTEGAGVNLLINNAGKIDRARIDEVTPEIMRELFEINTVAPLVITKAFLPLLRKAARACNDTGLSCSKAAIINITSKVGSCADNGSGGRYPYRTSKAALNMVTKSCAVDLLSDGILAAVLHPGWVQTIMGGPNALISTQECVQGMINVMAGFQEKDTGTFLDYKGQVVPW